jgi:hypothetical protein
MIRFFWILCGRFFYLQQAIPYFVSNRLTPRHVVRPPTNEKMVGFYDVLEG